MTVAKCDFQMDQGATFRRILILKQTDGTLMGLDNWTAAAQMRRAFADDTPTATFTIAVNTSSNLSLRSGIAPVREMVKRGCRVALGLDGMTLDEDDDALREMRLAHMLHHGVAFRVDVDRVAMLKKGVNITGWFRFLGNLDPDRLAAWMPDSAIRPSSRVLSFRVPAPSSFTGGMAIAPRPCSPGSTRGRVPRASPTASPARVHTPRVRSPRPPWRSPCTARIRSPARAR